MHINLIANDTWLVCYYNLYGSENCIYLTSLYNGRDIVLIEPLIARHLPAD